MLLGWTVELTGIFDQDEVKHKSQCGCTLALTIRPPSGSSRSLAFPRYVVPGGGEAVAVCVTRILVRPPASEAFSAAAPPYAVPWTCSPVGPARGSRHGVRVAG